VKRWQYILLLLLGLAGLWVYLHRQDLGLIPARGGDKADNASGLFTRYSEAPALRWETVDRSSEGFRIDLPTGYKEIHVPAYNDRGAAEQITMISANAGPEITYTISWADNPPVTRTVERSPARILDMARDNALAKSQTSLVAENTPQIGSYPTRDFSARNAGGGVMNTRMIYTGQRLYMLTAAFPSDHARSDQNIARFFNSFAFTESSRIPEQLPGAPPPATSQK